MKTFFKSTSVQNQVDLVSKGYSTFKETGEYSQKTLNT